MPVGLYALFVALGLFCWALSTVVPGPGTAPTVAKVLALVSFLLAVILAIPGVS
jgi:hypothetical protein